MVNEKTLKQLLKEKGSEDVQIDFYIDQIAEIVKEWLTQKRQEDFYKHQKDQNYKVDTEKQQLLRGRLLCYDELLEELK